MTEEYLTYGHRLEPHIADTAQPLLGRARRRPHRPLRGGAGDAARPRPRHLSLRHLLEPGRRRRLRRRRRRARRHRRGLGRRQGLRHPGRRRARSRPSSTTRSASRMVRARRTSSARPPAAPRRCGWIDLVALRYAVRLNTMDALVITKLDVLAGHRSAAGRVRYRHPEGAVFEEFPYHQSIIHSAEPEYEELPGLRGRHRRLPRARPTCPRGARLSRGDLRPRRRADQLVGVGPGRDQVVWMGRRPELKAASSRTPMRRERKDRREGSERA